MQENSHKNIKLKKKGFTLIELIIVIAILAIIMLIASLAYSGIQQRMKVRSDKVTCGEIGKALSIREADLDKSKGIPLYPKIVEYDSLECVDNYIKSGLVPQSMPDGGYIVTAIQTDTGKKIIVGIGKNGQEISSELYVDNKGAGWCWTEGKEVSEFITENILSFMPVKTLAGITGGNEEANLDIDNSDSAIAFVWDTTGQLSKSISIVKNGTTTIDWGDGTIDNILGSNVNPSHTYAAAGIYTVKIMDDVVTKLTCYNKKITNLDVSKATALKSLICGTKHIASSTSENQISNLKLSGAIALQELRCDGNQLRSLDVSHNTQLTSLRCCNNELTTLDVSNNTALTGLWCYTNQISTLNVNNNTELTSLDCSVNELTSLNVAGATKLQTLKCQNNIPNSSNGMTTGNNRLTSLDVRHNTALTQLSCERNQLSNLDISNNLSLSIVTVAQPAMNILVMDSRQTVSPIVDSNTKKVTITQTPNGKISYDDAYRFNIIPNSGYSIANLTVNGVAQAPATTYDFGSLPSNSTIKATFE